MILQEKLLFNPDASDDNVKVIGGETTNILNLANVKYKWAHEIFDAIYANNWLPHKTDMSNDKANWNKLTHDEQEAFLDIVSFLIFLDSIQTNNISNIAEYITAPDIVYVLTRQQYDEAVHSKSYGWINSSLFNKHQIDSLVYRWRNNAILLDRIKFIAQIYQDFKDTKTDENFIKVVVANYLLEGIYFYNAFQFFHNLASRGLMISTDTQIRYIQRDEIQHCNIFKNIINEIRSENPILIEEHTDLIYDMFKTAVDWEIKFSSDIIGNKILGITTHSIEDYSYHLANRRLKDIDMDQFFPKTKNPYIHLDLLAGVEDETSSRSNNFEVTSISYKNKSAIDGWDEI
jgi:ribonucleoside-diphosphate reductase beta chain